MATFTCFDTAKSVEYMLHHVFFPLQLPGGNDYDPQLDKAIIETVISALKSIRTKISPSEHYAVDRVQEMVERLNECRDQHGFVHQDSLLRMLKDMEPGHIIPIHIKAQNAGLLVRHEKENIVFEAFELSPPNSIVLATKGRLRRYFPHIPASVSIDVVTLADDGFKSTLSTTIAKMSHQPVAESIPQARKAGKSHDEERDATDPHVLLELLMSILRANGESIQVSGIWKNTRDDVLWSDGNKLPWRRSATWLLLRVSLQLTFERLSTTLYKRFQIFMMAHILAAADQKDFNSESLHCMNAKLAQRLRKLDLQTHEDWMVFVSHTMIAATHRCEHRWMRICEDNERTLCLTRPVNTLEREDTDIEGEHTYPAGSDIYFHLARLDTYLQEVTQTQRPTNSEPFNPVFQILATSPKHFPSIGRLPHEGPRLIYDLTAFEDWVEHRLAGWLEDRLGNSRTCSILGNAIQDYHERASREYEGLPEALSMMTLTILELWVASDKSATAIYSKLRDHNAEIPVEALGCLLLRLGKDLHRLSHVEAYLDERLKIANPEVYPSVFGGLGDENAFSARYFSDSNRLMSLKHKIDEDGHASREAKIRKLEQLKLEYSRLMRNYETGICTCQMDKNQAQDGIKGRHHPRCSRCACQEMAHTLSIEVHEWPLPESDLAARSVLFELNPPSAFASWRDSTFLLINKVLMCSSSTKAQLDHSNKAFPLTRYRGLRKYATKDIPERKVTLYSKTKSHVSTHRKQTAVTADTTKDAICVNHGLVWAYYSQDAGMFLDSFGRDDGLSKLCTFELPDRARSMQQFMLRPNSSPSGQYPNLAISLQHLCPPHFALDEFRSLCSLPLGHHIQWQNVLINFHAGSIDWKKVEAILFGFQLSQQAGPRGHHQVLRPSNQILHDDNFAKAMLATLEGSLQRVKENSESYLVIVIFGHIAGRLLSLGPRALQRRCFIFLRDCRQVCWNWLQILCKRASDTGDEIQRSKILERVLYVALICVDTFNVDPRFLEVLVKTPSEAMVLIRCFFAIQDTVFISSDGQVLQRSLLHRWRQLALKAAPMLLHQITKAGSPCLDNAIQAIWPSYSPADRWITNPKAQFWLKGDSANPAQDSQKPIYVSLLTGELRGVGGKSPGRLPRTIEEHPDYATFFGKSRLDVLSSTEPGFQFVGKNLFAGHAVCFGLVAEGDNTGNRALRLRASKNSHVYDFVPKHALTDKLPRLLSDKFVHWYSHDTGSIEFRPITQPWEPCSSNWQLSRTRTSWILKKGDSQLLLNPFSATVNSLLEIFSPLEDRFGLQIYFDSITGAVTIDIPRLQLSFKRDRGERSILSNQFQGMRVDESQRINTLIGLHSKFVLCDERDSTRRLVMIPEGGASCVRTESYGTAHVLVTIDQSKTTKVQTYTPEEHLGQLTGNGTLQSKLFLAYLHALISHCLPDSFTGYTGTESALSILRSEGVRSFGCLSKENANILANISKLSPVRTYYPLHLKVMQVVHWSPSLMATSQHGEFHQLVSSLFRQARVTSFLYPDHDVVPPNIERSDDHLYLREGIRSSTYRIAEFGAESHDTTCDFEYLTMDLTQKAVRAKRAFDIASLISRHRASLLAPIGAAMAQGLYTLLSQSQDLVDRNSPFEPRDLQYDCSLLQPARESFPRVWWRLHQALQAGLLGKNRCHIMMCLATMAYATEWNSNATQALVAIMTVPSLQEIDNPQKPSSNLSLGHTCSLAQIQRILDKHSYPLERCPEALWSNRPRERIDETNNRRKLAHQTNRFQCTQRVAQQLFQQWPVLVPVLPQDEPFAIYTDVPASARDVHLLFHHWNHNQRFFAYLKLVYAEMRKLPVEPITVPPCPSARNTFAGLNQSRFVSTTELFTKFLPESLEGSNPNPEMGRLVAPGVKMTKSRLSSLLNRLSKRDDSKREIQYFEDLNKSASCLAEQAAMFKLRPNADQLGRILYSHRRSAQQYVDQAYKAILQAVHRDQRAAKLGDTMLTSLSMVATTYQWPRISKRFFLSRLNRHNWQHLPIEWKKGIVTWCIGLTQLHRAERLIKALGNESDLIRELQNEGHVGWDPLQSPDSLLLEIESGLMIRGVQTEIARQMKSPPSNKNTVMQLNMGEGKSSVIVPLVASSLADTTCLVRVICAKSQSKQMLDVLVSKLGGLIDRWVFQMPITRALRIGLQEVEIIAQICQRCMLQGGVLLMQPEQILSLQLMGIECFIKGNKEVGKKLMIVQNFLDRRTRDVVDESDQNLSVKFELVYPIGQQRPIEHGPDRWLLIQEILDLIPQYSAQIQQGLQHSVEYYDPGQMRVPQLRLLRPEAVARLVQLLATHICEVGIASLPIARLPYHTRAKILKYISVLDLSAAEISAVEDSDFWNASTSKSILLVRGLLAGGILGFVLGDKRWHVNYGLDSTRKPRTRLAVPYLAKDCPASRSEFSHPDVVIVLTCLCYYYGGLNDNELFLSFNHLLRAEWADVEYQLWVSLAPCLPPAFRQLDDINIKDHEQCITQVFPYLRYSKGVIDYFLANLVFSKEMKEFPHKLSASGWDLAMVKGLPTTGFSGTNDSRHVLPLQIKQLDVPSQMHTNALVMEYLLQPENAVAMMPSHEQGVTSVGTAFLEMVTKMQPATRVILEVGAQIIEWSNLELARRWLDLSAKQTEIQAAVFFDEKDRISVINRQGQTELLQTSPYVEKLGSCLVFLDEAHTRGIDVRLPPQCRAAVTLGAGLTKDRLVQACMRMRKLGNGHSAVFCVPPEIQKRILHVTGNPQDSEITISDVLAWAMSETNVHLQRAIPIWAAQGRCYVRQKKLWEKCSPTNGLSMDRKLAKEFLEDEAKSIATRYRPVPSTSRTTSSQANDQTLNMIAERCQEFEITSSGAEIIEEEQERELALEVEQEQQQELAAEAQEERQVARPPRAEAAPHELHDNVKEFVATGKIPGNEEGFMWAFESLCHTTLADCLEVTKAPRSVRVTADFARTIKHEDNPSGSDFYQRNVQFVLTSANCQGQVEHLVVISPYEANELLESVRKSKFVVLHLYAPRQSRGFASLDQLRLYTVPAIDSTRTMDRRFVVELNVFAGQLYFSDLREYVETCDYLGLASRPAEEGTAICADGFIARKEQSQDHTRFTESPVRFLKLFLSKIRRDGRSIEKTHMGKILSGVLLTEVDFKESRDLKRKTVWVKENKKDD